MAATLIPSHTVLASVKSATIQNINAIIQNRTRKPTVFVLHNSLQEASERFLVSSKGSLTSKRVFDHQPRSLTSTRVFDHQPRFLDILYNLNLPPFLNVNQPFLVFSPNLGHLRSSSEFIPCSHSTAYPLHWLTAK